MTQQSGGSGSLQTTPVLQLNYVASTDLLAGVAMGLNTQVDVCTNQSFSVQSATSLLEVIVRGAMLIGEGTAGSTHPAISRLLLDSAGSNTPFQLSRASDYVGTTSMYANPLCGGPVYINGLAIGTHTIRVQVLTTVTGANAYLRAATNPLSEFLAIQVIEHR